MVTQATTDRNKKFSPLQLAVLLVSWANRHHQLTDRSCIIRPVRANMEQSSVNIRERLRKLKQRREHHIVHWRLGAARPLEAMFQISRFGAQ